MRRWCAALLLGCLLLTVRHVAADDDDEDDDDDVEVRRGCPFVCWGRPPIDSRLASPSAHYRPSQHPGGTRGAGAGPPPCPSPAVACACWRRPAPVPPLPHRPPSTPLAAQVTCGSLIKLEAEGTKHVLHSHEVSYGYGRGSGQQSVTAFPERDSGMSLWALRVADVSEGGWARVLADHPIPSLPQL